tara:strand:+ start:15528 stop:22868 length:7341 start_codon:yes stop_codon:yes gene_type:complete
MAGFLLFCSGEFNGFGISPLYTEGKQYAHSNLPLFHSGQVPPDDSISLYASGTLYQINVLSMHTISATETNDNVNLYAKAALVPNDPPMPLWVANQGVEEFASINMHLENDGVINKKSAMALNVLCLPQIVNATIPTAQENSPLFVRGAVQNTTIFEASPLFLQVEDATGQEITNENLSLFMSQSHGFRWDSENSGSEIEPDDNIFATIESTDPIRGVELICHGGCAAGTCDEVVLESHDTNWFTADCVDGGIFRAEKTYTNPNVNAFGSDVPYSGHFYGIRKFTGLDPFGPYNITMTGSSGSTARIPAPKQLVSWEYEKEGTNALFSGIKFIGDHPHVADGRNAGDNYGTSISVNADLLCVGSPNYDLDFNSDTLSNAGTVFVYRRGEEPASYTNLAENKADWSFETQLVLPSSIRNNYFKSTSVPLAGTSENVEKRQWYLGQEGRNFGSSLSSTVTSSALETTLDGKDKEIIVVGAPNGNFTETFTPPSMIENEVLMMVFTDEFNPTIGNLTYRDILSNIESKNYLYKYFSQPTIDVKIKMIVFRPISIELQTDLDFPEPKPTFISKKTITRHTNDIPGTSQHTTVDDQILQEIKDAFFELYPDAANHVPALLGVYIDNSRSLGDTAVNPAVSRFVDFFKGHASSEGLVDYNGSPTDGAVLQTTTNDENWITQSNALLDFALDSGRLIQENYLKLLTNPSTFGTFNTALPDFNDPPPSGGSVYVFEKESGVWDLIQEIKSPTEDNTTHPDFFGKAVDISKNAEVIGIGSPYMDSAVNIYEYDYSEKDRMYSNVEAWVAYHIAKETEDNFYLGQKTKLDAHRVELDNDTTLPEDDTKREEQVKLIIGKSLYIQLSADRKYGYRTDTAFWGNGKTIQEYKNIFDYKYSDIAYAGTYQQLVTKFAPTSRMGYSIAVNETGSAFAVGCPTDSLDVTDDSNLYYHPDNSGQILWPSYVNAGAVRAFESRKYYPHNKVVDYGKFGNTHNKTLTNPDLYNHYNQVYKTGEYDLDFVRTDFNDVDIPQDAGLLLINTPEVNFASLEIMNRIRNWLKLGDRNLVLIANNERWETTGNADYKASNDIVNDILAKLNSAMAVYDTDKKKTSLLNETNTCPDKVNVIPSSRPENSISSYIDTSANLRARGVGNIRVRTPSPPSDSDYAQNVSTVMYKNYICNDEYTEFNNHCSPTLENGTDLRSGWKTTNSVNNWPNFFTEVFGDTRQAPVPLMVAAEYKDPITVTIPATPARSGVFTEFDLVDDGVAPVFGDPVDGTTAFEWSEQNQNYSSLDVNFGNNTNLNRFFNPDAKLGIDPILVSEGSNGTDVVTTEKEMSPECYYAAEETSVDSAQSSIVLVGSLRGETLDKLYASSDRNINFYFNLVAKRQSGSSYIAQLNSFTGRSDFTDAKEGSLLELVFINTGNFVRKNVTVSDLYAGHPDGSAYDVCWIANPVNEPTLEEVGLLKKWLKKNNKKIVITYDNDVAASNVSKLCSLLGISMSPLYLPQRKKFANNISDNSRNNRFYNTRNAVRNIDIDSSHFVSKGFIESRDSISKLTIDAKTNTFIPINLKNAKPIALLGHPVVDDKFIDVGFHFMKTGVCKVDFPVQPNTAYKVFLDTQQYSDSEAEPLRVWVSDCNRSPSFTSVDIPPDQHVYTFSSSGTFDSVFYGPIGTTIELDSGDLSSVKRVVEFQTTNTANNISMFIEGNTPRTSIHDTTPTTLNLVSISGCVINVDARTVKKRVPRYVTKRISDPVDETTYTIEFEDPLAMSSSSQKYCPSAECSNIFEGTTIEDGPVVVAQEIYSHSGRSQGINPSRITVISDPDLIQGECLFDEDGVIRDSSLNFLQSLYPDTQFPSNANARIFDINKKLVAPERGSPARYINSVGKEGLVTRFMPPDGTISSGLLMSDFRDDAPNNISRPDALTDSTLATVSTAFINSENYYGSNSKFNWTVDGVTYSDTDARGGVPSIMSSTGKDFIDFNAYPSGYPGDLFGYSVDYYKDRIVVGTPFGGFKSKGVLDWDDVASNTSQYNPPSGTLVSQWGGAGSVYIYSRDSDSVFNFSQKLRPSGINVGHDLDNISDSELVSALGPNDYTLEELRLYSPITDKFGYSVAIDGDIIGVGTPGHDYAKSTIDSVSGAFETRSFNFEYDIRQRFSRDLGDPNTRALLTISSGILNNGAVYTFENRYEKQVSAPRYWSDVEKIVPQGYNSRLQQTPTTSGTENEHFGEYVDVSRAKRKDADYSIVIGSPYHKFATSGTHGSPEPLEGAGAAFLFDAMLRTPFAYDAGDANIDASVYGSPDFKVNLSIDNTKLNAIHYSAGLIYANNEGEIFIEASGQDENIDGFTLHRPYINSVVGRKSPLNDTENSNVHLFMSSVDGSEAESMPLFANTSNKGFVYNNNSITLFVGSFNTAETDTGLSLYEHCPSGTADSEQMHIFVSGTALLNETFDLITFGF